MINKREFDEFKELVKSEEEVKMLDLYLNQVKQKKFYESPVFPIVLSALFALVGTAFGAWLQGRSNLELEQKKFESELIVDMLEKAEDDGAAARHLDFLVKAGLIADEEGKIADLVESPGSIPSFGSIGHQLKELGSGKNFALVAQQKLKDLGFYQGPLSGKESEELRKAIMDFQKSTGSTADGIMNLSTLAKIEEAHDAWILSRNSSDD